MKRSYKDGKQKVGLEAMRAYKFRICPDTRRQKAIGDAISMREAVLEELGTYPANAWEASGL